MHKNVVELRLSLILIVMSALLWPFQLNAETKKQTEESPYLKHQVTSYVRYIPSRSVEAMTGEIKIIDSESEYSYAFKALNKLPIKVSLDTRYIGLEDTVQDVELPAYLTGLSADVETTLSFFNFNETYLRLALSPSFYADDWGFNSSSFRIPTRYFLIYQPSGQWTFLFGLAWYPDFEYEVLPILGLIYKPNDKLTFNIVPKRPNITYSFNDRFSLFAEGTSAFNNEFEVRRGNTKNVVLRYQERHLGAGIKFRLNQYIQSSLSVGGIFNRSLRYRDGQGKVNIKDGLYTELRVEIKS